MVPRCSPLVSLFILLNPALAAAQDLESRSQACIEKIREEYPRGGIRKGWLGSCQLETEVKVYSSDAGGEAVRRVPLFPRVASGADCTKPLGYEPAATSSDCGRTRTFITNYDRGISRIPLPGGRCVFMMPLLVTDKTDGFRCNAVRSRIACIRSVKVEETETVVRLGAKKTGAASEAAIRIPSDPLSAGPLFALAKGEPLFALLPSRIKAGSDPQSIVNYITDVIEAKEQQCRGRNGRQYCQNEKAYHAERMVQEVLRRAWSPTPLVSADERAADKAAFTADMRQHLGSAADFDTKALYELIVENEIGSDSPYQVTDAVIAKSGPSWGAHQIDIGANDQSEIDLFWHAIDDNQGAAGGDDAVARAIALKDCLSAPVRNYFTEHLTAFYSAAAGMDKALRTGAARKLYDDRFKAWLAEGIGEAQRLKALFKASPFARLYYLDVKNQFGNGRARSLKLTGESYSSAQTSDCDAVKAGELRLVSAIRATGYSPSDITRRVTGIHEYMRHRLGPSEGRPACN